MFETAGVLIKALTLGIAARTADRGQAAPGSDRQTGAPVPRADAGPGPAAVIALEAHRPKPLPRSAPRKPAAAARRFLTWLLDSGYGEPGQELFWANGPTFPYRDPQRPGTEVGLWELYQWHCTDENTTPIASNTFAEALGKLCKKRLVRERSAGKLRRLTVYRLPEPKPQRAAA